LPARSRVSKIFVGNGLPSTEARQTGAAHAPFIFPTRLPINTAAGRGETVQLAEISNPGEPKAPPRQQATALEITPLGPEAVDPDLILPKACMLGLMAGRSLAMQHLFARMRCTAPHFRLATVEGEPGTGRMLAAQTLHHIGPAAAGPFSPYVAADFVEDAPTLWRNARGGLVYLSRVDELSADQQRTLRDFLERAAHERFRLHALSGPLQLVAGSSQPLRRRAAAGSFRSDLASHLTAIRFALPPLRERRDDIPLLAALFLRQWSARHAKPLRGFAPGALDRLTAHAWPGNVSELESVIGAAALETNSQWIRPIDIPRLEWPAAPPAADPDPVTEDPNLDHAILCHVARVLARVNGNKVRAARMLGISRSTLYRMLEDHPPRT
jgi:DNA-binding NtrC family response regulator